MKTPNPQTLQIPRRASATALGVQPSAFMKTKLRSLQLAILLCVMFATTVVFGQTTFTWTNSAGGQLDLATNFNWNPNGVPNPNTGGGDTMQFDGQSTGPVIGRSNSGLQTGSSGSAIGLNVHLTANQVSPVTFDTTVANTASTGIRFNGITVDSGAASFIMGSDATTNAFDTVWGGVSGQIQNWVNNSANPVIITPNTRFRFGGGGNHTFFFQGTGDFRVTNDLVTANASAMSVAKTGPGTMIWAAGHGPFNAENSTIQGPVILNGGTLILKSSTLLQPSIVTGTLALQNNDGSIPTLLEYDATAQSGTIGLTISGPLDLQVNSGTLTLSSAASTFNGNVFLSGGELIVGGADNGTTGPLGSSANPISFTGGTLGFSANNTFDYSSRFTNAANQAYSFDTIGQSVTFATGLASTGGTLTKSGPGNLTLSGASSYSGATTVSGGKLVFVGSKTGSGNITVAAGATVGVTDTGTQVTPGTLTTGDGSTTEFNNINSTATAPLAASTLTAPGTLFVNVNSGTFTVGQSYPLFAWISGSAPTVSLDTLIGAAGNLSISANTVRLNITGLAYTWTGATDGNWNTTSTDWKVGATPGPFVNGGAALFDDSATANLSVTVATAVSPGGVTVNTSTNVYTITSSGANNIGCSGGLTKNGNVMLTLAGGANTYTGVTKFNAGIVSVSALANGGSASDIGAASSSVTNLVFNGGTLQYTGPAASIDRLFAVRTGGGTIDSSSTPGTGGLNLNNTGSVGLVGTGARVLTLTGLNTDTNLLAASLGNNGGATILTKSGAGLWVLTGTNTYSGVTTIANGTLQIGNGGTSGTLGSGAVTDNGSLIFNRSDALTNSSVISGTGSVSVNGPGTIVLAANETYTGGSTINAGTLQVGTGGAVGAMPDRGIVDNGLLVFNSTAPTVLSSFNSIISGTGNVIVHAGFVKAYGQPGNTYTGWTQIDPGATFQFVDGNQGASTSPVITNNGTLFFTGQEFSPAARGCSNNIVGTGRVLKDNNNANPGWIVIAGTNNTYTGGTFIAGGAIQLGDGINVGAGTIVGNVVFTNTATANLLARTLIFNYADSSVTFPGSITSVVTDSPGFNSGALLVLTNKVILTGNNSYPGSTTISNSTSTLQVGNGGTSGSIGSGGVVNEGTLIFNRSDSVTLANVISGGVTQGSVVQAGSGTLTLTAPYSTNLTTGSITVSNGTLVLTAAAGDVNVKGGTLAAVSPSAVGTLIVSNNLNISSGTVLAVLNKSLSPQSNSVYSVTNGINYTGGSLQVVNVGPALAVGDKFTIFSKPVTGGAGVVIVPPAGVTFANNLAADGSITVSTIPAVSPVITVTHPAGQVVLSWPIGSLGMHVQVQTNTLAAGLKTNWVTIPGTDLANGYTNTINPTNGAVFYRLAP